jgi:hypothetical protein
MATETDIRLRSRLDANQRDREQMCRSILALDSHYTEIRPRHPLGGPDGGRDIEALFEGDRVTFGAVGFANSANDSPEQKRVIRSKFSSDLDSAFSAEPKIKAFVFLTNLHFTMGEQQEMKEEARSRGIEHCDVLDRERLRIELDSPAGFFIRFQYLDIPLSEAEQASFLSRYGDRIQEVVSTGFERVERTLNRILFLQEAGDVLDGIYVRFSLKQPYPADQIGHFRAFVHVLLRAIKHDIVAIWFGSSDRAGRYSHDMGGPPVYRLAGIAAGIGSGQWEKHIRAPGQAQSNGDHVSLDSLDGSGEPNKEPNRNDVRSTAADEKLTLVGAGSSIGYDPVPSITVHYSHDDPLIRFRPRLQLRDLDDCTFMPVLNQSLAEKLHSIEVFANAYKVASIGPEEFQIDRSTYPSNEPGNFTPEELADPWVRIRPTAMASAFHLHFSLQTPRRMYGHTEMQSASPPKRESDR